MVGVKTRARAALAMAAAAAATTSSPEKKIKKVSKSSSSLKNIHHHHQLRNRRGKNLSAPEYSVERGTTSSEFVEVEEEAKEEVANCSSSDVITTTNTSRSRSDFPPSCCSSNNDQSSSCQGDQDVVRIADPEHEQVESGEASSKQMECHRTEAREDTKSGDQESPATTSSTKLPDTKSTVQMKRMPSDTEIEEFFVAAEKDLQKRFSDKYNYDIVKDVPLEGRYDWVQIKP